MLYFRDKHKNPQTWHVVRNAKDPDGKPLVGIQELKPRPKPRPRPKKFPLGTIFIHTPAEMQSAFMCELNARLIFLHQELNPRIELKFGGEVYIAIEPRNRFYVVPEKEVPYDADVWAFDEKQSIGDMIELLWWNYIRFVPLQIKIDTYSQITPAWFDIFENRITFFYGRNEYSIHIDLTNLEYLANMYDHLVLSPDNKMIIKSMSKHVVYYDGQAVGALLLEDVMMMVYLHHALKMEGDCIMHHILPDYTELEANIDKYVAKWTNFLPKRINDLMANFNNQYIQLAMVKRQKFIEERQKEVDEIQRPFTPDIVLYMDEDGTILTPDKVNVTPIQI